MIRILVAGVTIEPDKTMYGSTVRFIDYCTSTKLEDAKIETNVGRISETLWYPNSDFVRTTAKLKKTMNAVEKPKRGKRTTDTHDTVRTTEKTLMESCHIDINNSYCTVLSEK